MLGKNTLVKCLEVHLTLTKSILGRNDHFLHVMSLHDMSYYVVTTYHDVVTGLQLTLTGIPSSGKVIFRLGS